jgi:hypothetical protein
VGGRHLVGDPDPVAGCRVLYADGGVRPLLSFRGDAQHRTTDAQLHIGESRGSGFASRPGTTPIQKEKRAEPARL